MLWTIWAQHYYPLSSKMKISTIIPLSFFFFFFPPFAFSSSSSSLNHKNWASPHTCGCRQIKRMKKTWKKRKRKKLYLFSTDFFLPIWWSNRHPCFLCLFITQNSRITHSNRRSIYSPPPSPFYLYSPFRPLPFLSSLARGFYSSNKRKQVGRCSLHFSNL